MAPGLGVYRNQPMEADVYRKLAHAYSAGSKYDSSLYCLQQALEIDSAGGPGEFNLIEDYRRMGLAYGYKGDYINSIRFLNRSLELSAGMEKSMKDTRRSSVGDTYLSLAQVNYVIGNFREAGENVGKAVSIYKTVENEHIGLLESYLLLGKIWIEEGEIKEGLRLIDNSIRIAESNNINTARHYQAIGSAYLLESKYEEALKSRILALQKAEESKIIPQITWMNVKVGDVYSYIGDDKKAASYYESALNTASGAEGEIMAATPSLQMRLGNVQLASEYYSRSGSLTGTALAWLRLGEINEKNQVPDKAEYYFNKSDSIFKIIGSKAGQAQSKLGLCRILINRDLLSRANSLISQIGDLNKNPEIEWQLRFEKGRIFEKQKNIYAAFLEYSKSVEIIEKIRGDLNVEEFRSAYMTDKMHVYERLIMLLIEYGKTGLFDELKEPPVESAFYYSERARSRSFLDMLGNIKISSKETSDTMLLDKEFRLRLQIQKVTKEIEMNKPNETDTEELEKHLGFLNEEYLKTLDLIKLSNSDYNSLVSVEPSGLPEVQELLSDKNVIIEYWIGEEKSVIWVVTNKVIEAKIIDAGAGKIEKMISDCRTMIRPGARQEYKVLLTELYNELILPVEPEINDHESLYIIPHRSLHFLPFQALIDPTGRYLIEKFTVSYAPSSSVLKQCSLKESHINKDFLGMALGNISIGDLSPLPGTKAELNQIIQLYPGATVKYENETSETYFKTEAKNHNILHLATHGSLNSRRPMDSYLLMPPDDNNDGQLTVSEIFDLNLQSKLVVLSACKTGLGILSTGDELIGLSRAFIYAGTPAIIVSLWSVEDASTAVLMTRLHQYYSAGYRLQDALASAQRDLINDNFRASVSRSAGDLVWDDALKFEIETGNKSKEKNPFFWAPFILIGYGDQELL
jgi:CHAT domain-containing protein